MSNDWVKAGATEIPAGCYLKVACWDEATNECKWLKLIKAEAEDRAMVIAPASVKKLTLHYCDSEEHF